MVSCVHAYLRNAFSGSNCLEFIRLVGLLLVISSPV